VGAQLGVTQPLYTGAGDRGDPGGPGRLATVRTGEGSRGSGAEGGRTTFYDILLAREMHAISLENRDQKTRFLDEAQRRTPRDGDGLRRPVAKVALRTRCL